MSDTAGAQQRSDADIERFVRAALVRDPGVDAREVKVNVSEGIVELTGATDDLLSKRRASLVVGSVRGVRAVSDRLTLSLPARPDEDLRRAVGHAFLYNAATEAYEVHPTVQDGVVTLNGRVQSWQERELAGRVAEGVAGVRSVVNDVVLDMRTDRTDAEIAADVRSKLRWDTLVRGGLIDVSVKEGKVSLRGGVGSYVEKRRAFTDAWVRGVTGVDDDGLEVQHWLPEQKLRIVPPNALTDARISAAIRDAVALDPRVMSSGIRVAVRDGVATLSGSVSSMKGRAAAEALSRATVGVKGVQNQLQIQPTKFVTDEELTRRVKDSLVFDPVTDAYEIRVAVERGTVTLAGRVDSAYERAQATDVAAGIAGVKSVRNEIEVNPSGKPFVHRYLFEPYEPQVYDWYVPPRHRLGTDAEIAERIREELAWSPFVDERRVEVSVSAGRAVLSGTVDSVREYRAATDNAYEGGALAVENRLSVTGP